MVTLTLVHTESSRTHISRPYFSARFFLFSRDTFFHATLMLMYETSRIGPDIS